MDEDGDVDDFERIRQQNLKELQLFLADSLNDPQYKKAIEAVTFKKPEISRKRKSRADETFHFTGLIPLERRKSARLSNLSPQYTQYDLKDEDIRSYDADDSDIENLEKIVYRKKRSFPSRKNVPFEVVPVESITIAYLAKVAVRSKTKQWSTVGSTCHQCRQKTLDSKTYCRSPTCIGVRGQFCGPCLRVRYGEDAVEALKDPNWICPVCRGLCNCSICRTHKGKRPTGILAPTAFRLGHNSVKDFLESLGGKGDYVTSDGEMDDNGNTMESGNSEKKANVANEGSLLGFNKNLYPVMYRKPEDDEEVFLLGFNMEGTPLFDVEHNVIVIK